ncbi:MAG: hypothetical protein WC624_05395 [Candidatus Margulisiibacteriota bacterium]
MNIDLNKVYYYIIALVTFFVLLWGTIDLVSGLAGMATGKYAKLPADAEKSADPGLEEFYQQRIAQDRTVDSLARILVSGSIFLYAKFKLKEQERSA